MNTVFQLSDAEEILWSSKPSSNTVWRGAACNHFLPFVILWLFFHITVFLDLWKDFLHDSPLLFLFGYMLPVWLYLLKGYWLLRAGGSARYCVTNQAVYTRYKGEIRCKPLSEICKVRYEKGRFTDFSDVGTVRCIFRKPDGRVPEASEEKNYSLLLRMVDDFRNVGKLIEKACREEREAQEAQEKKLQKAKSKIKVPGNMLEAINEAPLHAEPVPQTTMPELPQSSVPVLTQMPLPESPQTVALTGDPDAAFFGMQNPADSGQQKTFLAADPMQALAVELPDDTVADLQAELYGGQRPQAPIP